MDLHCTAEDEAFRARVRAWFEQNRPGKLETHEQRKAWHRRLYDAGFIGLDWPSEYGGHDARPMEQAILSEETARAKAPPPVNGLGICPEPTNPVTRGVECTKCQVSLSMSISTRT